jgi:hypothetical protein
MFYTLLGKLTWKGAQWFLHRKYGTAIAPKPLLAGGLLIAILGIALATRQRIGSSDG